MIYPWQTLQWQQFCQQKIQQRVPHAIVLLGAEGLGKRAFANQLVATLLCEINDAIEPCGQCHSCHLFLAESHPDHIVIEPEETGKQIKIDQIRKLKDKQELTPTVSRWKTVIISPADSMNINANNSLLKLLEEPQPNTLLILITAKAEKLPITILSRCQKMIIPAPEKEIASRWLQQQTSFSEPDIAQLLPLAHGAPLKVLTMLEQGVVSTIEQLKHDFDSLLNNDINPVLLAKNWQQYDLLMILNILQNLIHKRIVNDQKQLSSESTERYWTIYDCIITAIKLTSSPNNINKILLIEQFMVSVMNVNLRYNTANNSSI
ncbi:MAG: DNA polymerase III subunit delta' [Piscirickettsiaceae bacterium]|nr:DNA polymerase III subunit delta' [Piscirickettsiaceae bacterium]